MFNRLVVALVAALALLAASCSGGAGVASNSDSGDASGSIELVGLGSDVPGSFLRLDVSGPVGDLPAPAPVESVSIAGDVAGLHAGIEGDAGCARSALVDFALSDDSSAIRWRKAAGLDLSSAEARIARWTPAMTGRDLFVQQIRDGEDETVTVDVVLQAGTAVFLADDGRPIVRCSDGTLLRPAASPAAWKDRPTSGTGWPRFRLADVKSVVAGEPVKTFELVAADLNRTPPMRLRAVGSDGDRDARAEGSADDGSRELPDVVSKDASSSIAALEALGLVVRREERHDTVVAGRVISTTPAAGEAVQPGDDVTVVVSLGPVRSAVIPDVVGLTEAVATAKLRELGLRVETTQETTAKLVEGTVAAMNPVAGVEREFTDPVTLIIARYPTALVVDVTGRTYANGGGVLASTFAIESERVFSDTLADGVIVRTNPPGGQTVRTDTKVVIAVSQGPARVVPNLAGLTSAEASAELAAIQLTVSFAPTPSTTVPAGIVIASNPGPSTPLVTGSGVAVIVSSGPPPPEIIVPNVLGLTQAAAVAQVTAIGLTPTVFPQAHPTIAAGIVSGTVPGATTPLPPGGTVQLVVSTGPQPPPAG